MPTAVATPHAPFPLSIPQELAGRSYIAQPRVLCCSNCHAHLTNHDDVYSKNFQGRHGRAYLCSNVVNVSVGAKEQRLLITGLHTVADITCNHCATVLGWKYEHAFEPSQKYKEGKFIVEKRWLMQDKDTWR
ncbi:hypothetical protein FOA52_011467 [Chlamydomonas sp. UWO 241]|nr:hypothetical protein FOA52_011467 [Chlamydomonas sp. UWO 241]